MLCGKDRRSHIENALAEGGSEWNQSGNGKESPKSYDTEIVSI